MQIAVIGEIIVVKKQNKWSLDIYRKVNAKLKKKNLLMQLFENSPELMTLRKYPTNILPMITANSLPTANSCPMKFPPIPQPAKYIVELQI